MKPTVGRIVEYQLVDKNGKQQTRPAIVVRVWDRPDDVMPLIQLQVFADGTNDMADGANVVWRTIVHYDPNKGPDSWDWMEYQKGQAAKTEAVEAQLNRQGAAPEPKGHAESIAHLCHEVNRAYCRSIGDDSQPSWADAPQWQKDSAINGVEFHLANDVTPEQSHLNWVKEKEATGWIYGPVKDPEKKHHPCMIAYSSLPKEQRTKDYLFKAIVDTCNQF